MKIIFTLFAAALLSCCSHDDDHTVATTPQQQADLLPAASQTGANTVGCLVNGQAFVPYGNIAGGNKHLYYQDGMNFNVYLGRKEGNGLLRAIIVTSNNESLSPGQTYQLSDYSQTSKSGEYILAAESFPSPNYYSTTSIITGELKITHHDFDRAIMSGTFWFDAVNSEGTKVEVREGRFDMQY